MTNEALIEACPNLMKLKFIDLRGIKILKIESTIDDSFTLCVWIGQIKNSSVSTLVRKCVHLEGIALAECVHISDAAILEIATYKQQIKYLDVSGCKKIGDNSLRSIAAFCSKLEHLNVKATAVTDTGYFKCSN